MPSRYDTSKAAGFDITNALLSGPATLVHASRLRQTCCASIDIFGAHINGK